MSATAALPSTFVVEASIVLRHGPAFGAGVETFELCDTPQLRVVYERWCRQEIIDVRRITGAPGGWSDRFAPAGIVKVLSRQPWPAPEHCLNRAHRVIHLAGELADQIDSRVASTVRGAMAAFEMSTDSHVEVWNTQSSGYWIDELGAKYGLAGGRGEVEVHPVTSIGPGDRERFERLSRVLSEPQHEPLRAAYAVARLKQQHLAPAARIVFGWALLERLAKCIKPNERPSHRQVRDFILQVCQEADQQASIRPIELPRLREAIEQAYKFRNGLAHGEPEGEAALDFPALARAATLMARRLSTTVP